MTGPHVERIDPEASRALLELLDVRAVERDHMQQLRRIEESHPPEANRPSPDIERTPLEVAPGLWQLASDHLRAWWHLLHQTLPLSAHVTLARGALDCSLLLLWILDGDQPRSWRERAARYQLEDHRNRRVFERNAGMPDDLGEGMTGAQRLAALEQAMRAANLNPDRPPRWINLYRDYVTPADPDAGEAVYRIFSAHAHGFPWAMLTYERLAPTAGVGGLGTLVTDDRYTVQYAHIARLALDRASAALRKLEGPLT